MNAALTASIEGERLDLVATGAWTAERDVRLSEADRGLMEGVRLNNRAAVTANAQTNPFVALLDGIGRSLAEIGQSLVLFAHLLGALTKVTLGTLAHPARLIFGH